MIAELELRDDATMKIGGKIQAPKALDLFKKEFKKELVKFRLRFGVPGLSIQLPVVGVIGLEVQLSGGADIFAGLRAGLEDITVAGSFDTATDAVELDVGGKIVGEAWAGVGVNLKGSVNLGIGPAYIGGYLKARGEAKILGKIFAGAKAHYSSQTQDIVLDVDAGVSAGLQASLGISAGIHAGIDLWLKDINVEIIDKSLASWKYDLGKKLDYNPKFKYKLGGRAPSDQDLQPKDKPRISAKDLATKALKRLKG